jgi:hypothetical protein
MSVVVPCMTHTEEKERKAKDKKKEFPGRQASDG